MKWLFVATAHCWVADALPDTALKPLATYFGLPLGSEPWWWTVFAAVITAGLVVLFVYGFRQQGASKIVALGPVLVIALSNAFWLLFIKGVALAGLPADQLDFGTTQSWPLRIFVIALFVGSGLFGIYLARGEEPAPPSRALMIASSLWTGFVLLVIAFSAWSILGIRAIL